MDCYLLLKPLHGLVVRSRNTLCANPKPARHDIAASMWKTGISVMFKVVGIISLKLRHVCFLLLTCATCAINFSIGNMDESIHVTIYPDMLHTKTNISIDVFYLKENRKTNWVKSKLKTTSGCWNWPLHEFLSAGFRHSPISPTMKNVNQNAWILRTKICSSMEFRLQIWLQCCEQLGAWWCFHGIAEPETGTSANFTHDPTHVCCIFTI